MATVSLCMIVKNEEAVLARCLDSICDLVDEIIILDTGSSDKTVEIARRYTPHVLFFEWIDDFSAARNAAFAQATMDYQMWMDADDMLPPDQAPAFAALVKSLTPEIDVVTLPYHCSPDEQGKPLLTFRRERLLRRKAGFRWVDPIHEYIPTHGNIVMGEPYIEHRKLGGHGDRNLRIYQRMLEQDKALNPRQLYYYGRELCDHGHHADSISTLSAFLDGGAGWVEDNIGACLMIAQCHTALGEVSESRRALLRSMEYAAPRAQVCCQLGYHHREQGDEAGAVFWFESALHCPRQSAGFRQPTFEEFLPHLELCVSYWRLQDKEQALVHHHAAAALRPEHPAVKLNTTYFNSL